MPDALGHSNFLYNRQNDFSMIIDTAHKRCEGQVIGGIWAKAYTVTWEKIKRPDKQDFIQLCPWWLDHISKQEHLSSKIPPNAEIKKTNFPKEDEPWMDVYLLIEQSLIHEVLPLLSLMC